MTCVQRKVQTDLQPPSGHWEKGYGTTVLLRHWNELCRQTVAFGQVAETDFTVWLV